MEDDWTLFKDYDSWEKDARKLFKNGMVGVVLGINQSGVLDNLNLGRWQV